MITVAAPRRPMALVRSLLGAWLPEVERERAETGRDVVVVISELDGRPVVDAMPRSEALEIAVECGVADDLLAGLAKPAAEGSVWVLCLSDRDEIACVEAAYGYVAPGGEA